MFSSDDLEQVDFIQRAIHAVASLPTEGGRVTFGPDDISTAREIKEQITAPPQLELVPKDKRD